MFEIFWFLFISVIKKRMFLCNWLKEGRPKICVEKKSKFFSLPGLPWLSMTLVVREPRKNLPSGPWVWKDWEPLIYGMLISDKRCIDSSNWMNDWMNEWLNKWMKEWTSERTNEWMNERTK